MSRLTFFDSGHSSEEVNPIVVLLNAFTEDRGRTGAIARHLVESVSARDTNLDQQLTAAAELLSEHNPDPTDAEINLRAVLTDIANSLQSQDSPSGDNNPCDNTSGDNNSDDNNLDAPSL